MKDLSVCLCSPQIRSWWIETQWKQETLCRKISKGLFVADASLKKLGLQTPWSFCYCSKFACISCTNCWLEHYVSKHMIWQSSSRNGTSEVRQSWCDFASKGSTITWKKTEQTFHGQSAVFYLKTKRRDYILLILLGKKCVPSSLFDRTVFLAALSDYFTSMVEC